MARKAASHSPSRPTDPAERDRQILAALDLRSEFAEFGVVFAKDFPNAAGWLDCYAVGRDDRTPSAGCNIRTGRYHDFGGGENISFWEFAAAHGNFADWRAAREHYAAKVGMPPVGAVIRNSVSGVARAETPGKTARNGGDQSTAKPQSATSTNGHPPRGAPTRNPLDQLSFQPWTPAYKRLATLWCLKHKPGATIEAIHAAGVRVAIYKTKTKAYTVLALPVYGESITVGISVSIADPIAYVAWQLNGQPLPVFRGKGKPIEWIKIKTFGPVSGGLIGRHGIERLQNHSNEGIATVWKVEGPSDLLALWSAIPADQRDANPIVCNAGGATENVQPHVAGLFSGLPANIIHDADTAGETGATKWLSTLAGIAGEVRHVRLPYDVETKHGKDLRDWLREPGNSFETLLAIASETPVSDVQASSYAQPSGPITIVGVQPSASGHAASPSASPIANEADNDPHRLARVYLERHARTLRYWRQEWWRYDGRRYVRFSVAELAAEITAACKAEFDRINLAALESPETAGADGKLPEAHKVTRALVSNVVAALEGMALVCGGEDQPSWIGEPPTAAEHPEHRPSPHCIALTNGILDLDSLLAGEEDRSKILLPHSPAWFSPICLPYDFNEEADCPRWNAFLSRNLEDDAERINLLQEWAGYLLLPDANQQKFLFLEGEGSNGKSVYHAAIEGMLGRENVAHVPLESFGQRFALYSTIGKLANIAADCGELDKAAEGILKSFTSGDRMTFDRKNLPPVEATPTARMSIAANNRPRFSDRSSGLWRRLMIVPFNVQIEESEKVKGMDKPEWWQAAGELPGILNWAIAGLWRLREQGRFTESQLGAEALEDYRSEANPARAFLQMTCRLAEAQISCGGLYDAYKSWSKENGYHPVNERNFGKEVIRIFSQVERRRIGSDGNRSYVYFGLFANGIDF